MTITKVELKIIERKLLRTIFPIVKTAEKEYRVRRNKKNS